MCEESFCRIGAGGGERRVVARVYERILITIMNTILFIEIVRRIEK
jgi:hypothetical protein